MAATLSTIVIDATDIERLADFWSHVLGWTRTGAVEDDGAIEIADAARPDSVTILFQPVLNAKGDKNRVHIDVRPAGIDQDQELARLLELGAHQIDVGQGQKTWFVLADPEGNEFCLLRGRATD